MTGSFRFAFRPKERKKLVASDAALADGREHRENREEPALRGHARKQGVVVGEIDTSKRSEP
jgi:hypothetical protein